MSQRWRRFLEMLEKIRQGSEPKEQKEEDTK